jgi:hypothetical protein
MAKISREIIREIQKDAKTYMRALKGDGITRDDIMVAENLMVFGYRRGLGDREKNQNERNIVKENPEPVNPESE